MVLIGAAGAGKSTFASRWFDDREILSSDRYRELVSGDASDQSATREAFRRLHHDLGRRLSTSGTAVVDATNVRPASRATLVAMARAVGVPAVAIVLDLPAEVILARNAGRRERIVPEHVVRRHLDDLDQRLGGRPSPSGRPSRDGTPDAVKVLEREGFDVVRWVTSAEELDDLVLIRGSAPRRR